MPWSLVTLWLQKQAFAQKEAHFGFTPMRTGSGANCIWGRKFQKKRNNQKRQRWKTIWQDVFLLLCRSTQVHMFFGMIEGGFWSWEHRFLLCTTFHSGSQESLTWCKKTTSYTTKSQFCAQKHLTVLCIHMFFAFIAFCGHPRSVAPVYTQFHCRIFDCCLRLQECKHRPHGSKVCILLGCSGLFSVWPTQVVGKPKNALRGKFPEEFTGCFVHFVVW